MRRDGSGGEGEGRAAPGASAALLESVLQASPAAIALLRGPDFRYQLVNPAYQRLDPRRELLGRTYAECWPEAADQVVPTLRKTLRDGETIHATDVRFELARGTTRATEEAFFTYTFLRVDPDATGEPGILVTAVETTGQVHARRRAEEGEERLRLALDASRSGMWEWDLATGENVWSDSLWELYGLRREGRKPSHDLWRESIHPSERDRVVAEVLEAAKAGTPLEIEYRAATADDEGRWLVARGTPVRDASGAVARYRGVVFDVTASRRAARLEAESDRLVAVEEAVANLDVGVAVVEAGEGGSFRVIATNAAYRAITGVAPAPGAPLVQLPHSLYAPDRVTLVRPQDWPGPAAARSGHSTRNLEIHLRRADGSWRIVSMSAAPVGGDQPGRPRQAVALMVDVTDRVQAEEERRAADLRFRALHDTLPEGVVFQDPRGRVVGGNEAACRILGLTLDELTGRTSQDPRWKAVRPDGSPFPGEDHPAMVALRTGAAVPETLMGLEGAGKGTRWLRVAAVPVTGLKGSDPVGVYTIFQDVTDQRTAGAELQASEARFRGLVERLPVGITESDAEGRNVYANAAIEVITGRPASEIRGNAWHDAIHPDDRDRLTRAWRTAVEAGRPFEDEWRVLRPDGETRHVHGFSTILRDAEGRTTGFLGGIRDVTAERKAVADLEESRTRLEAALASMTDAVFISDEQGRFVLFNDAFATFHRFRSREECRRNLAEYPDILDVYLADGSLAPLDQWAVPRALRGEVATNAEYGLRRKDTGETWVGSYSFAPIRRDGAIVGSVVVARDVTDRKRAEETLRASEARFRDVASSVGEYVFEMDPRGVITYISEAVEKVLGWRPEEMIGRPSFDFMDPEEVPRSGAYLADKVARKERFSRLEQVALHRSGGRVYLEISAVPVLARDGALLGYRGAAMDVTERREAEAARGRLQEQLAQSQKMEVVGRLAGGVAHDFNNLLTIILTCGLELRDDLQAGRPADPEQAADVVAAAQRAADLTRQLLAFARREVMTPEVLDLNEVLRQARKLIGRVIGEDVRVVEDLQEGLWNVRCDRGLLSQVVMNLAVNARDAMPRGGTLLLATSNRHFALREPLPSPDMVPGDWVELRVRDDGQGMTREVLAHAFEPFFTTKPAGSGTGLGLATVYGIVRQAGGAITVGSQPREGAEFRIFLPALPPDEASPVTSPVVVRGGTESILVVEDEPKVRQATARALRSAGYRVQEAASGEEALAWLRNEAGPVDLVVTDVVMTGMGGRDFARAVDVLRPGTRVLYVSGFTQDVTLRQGVLAEGLDFLAKPFTPESLRARVRELLDRA